MFKFNSVTRLDLKKRLNFLDEITTEKVICIFEDAILLPPEHRELIGDEKIRTK